MGKATAYIERDALFVAMRLGDASEIQADADLQTLVERYLETALAKIGTYVDLAEVGNTDGVPYDIVNQAVIMFATYLNDTSRDNAVVDSFRLSGAQALLADFRGVIVSYEGD